MLILAEPCISAWGQSAVAASDLGTPWIRNYPPAEYQGHNQIWSITQDHRGVIYAGHMLGIAEYDGVSWRNIPTTHSGIVRSLAVTDDGIVHVGGFGEFGYLAPDAAGRMTFVSLLPEVPEDQRDFADVWQTLVAPEGIYFVSQKYIFRWDGRTMRSWPASTSFHVGFLVRGRFYVRQQKTGLMQLEGDKLVMSPLGERFADERIMAILPLGGNAGREMLLCTRSNGLQRYDGRTITAFPTEADALFRDGQIYCATVLADGRYAIGTLQQGVIIIDEKGRVHHRLNKSSGLQDETIWYLFPDREGGLWIGMHLGLSRTEPASPFTHFTDREGLEGSILDIRRHAGALYAAGSMGVFRLEEKAGTRMARFRRVTGVSPQAWALQPFEEDLLAGVFDGVYAIRGDRGRIIDSCYAMALLRSSRDPSRVFIGMQKGLKSLRRQDGRWIDEGPVPGIEEEINHILETADGRLWLTARYGGIIHVDGGFSGERAAAITRYDTTHGLPAMERNVAFLVDGALRFSTSDGIYRFEQGHFIPDTVLLGALPTPEKNIFLPGQAPDGSLWLVTAGALGHARRSGSDRFAIDMSPFRRIAHIDDYFVYADGDRGDAAWIGGLDRVIRYEAQRSGAYGQVFQTLIREVRTNEDSVRYGGAGLAPAVELEFRPRDKSVRIHFAAATFDDERGTEFQYKLEGYDDAWSAWSNEAYKDFTGLPAGKYIFLVRARNVHGQVGTTGRLAFCIRPPFYLSGWAIAFYVMVVAAGLYALWRWQTARLRARHADEIRKLEYEKLKDLDQLKTRFFANITHEFRTPLTLILGPADRLLETDDHPERARSYRMISQNARRLLRLINQLLDLSKLDAGKMEANLRMGDIARVIAGIVHSFEGMAAGRGIALRFESVPGCPETAFDRDKIEQVFLNLIGNAIKFTPPGGRVDVRLDRDPNGECILVRVADSGPGIAADQLPFIFDRFYQGKEADRRGDPGTGIGLALTREFVELHGGQVGVKSRVGEGTEFTVMLPLRHVDSPGQVDPVVLSPPVVRVSDDPARPSPAATAGEEDLDRDNTLLLVEDNAEMRAFIREIVADRYVVLEAEDGTSGLAVATDRIPDIIISDVMMPGMDGLELCTALKGDPRTSHIPVILLTSKADIASRLEGLTRGADDYLAKPFHHEEILLRLRNLLGYRERLRARFSTPGIPVPSDEPEIQVEDAFLVKIRDLLMPRLSDTELEIDAIARMAGMSRSQLFRKIKALTGQSPSVFIRSIRLQVARELLETTDLNVSEVAYQVGFSTPAYFSDVFLEAFGVRPSHFRKPDTTDEAAS